MKASCVSYPEKEPLLLVRKSQIKLCEGNTGAAALLAYFEYWHNIKLEMQSKNIKSNDVAEIHGDERTQDESLYQFHTQDEIAEGLLGFVGRPSISKGIRFLEEKGYISIHRNPNPKYKFDNTKFFLYHPERVIEDLSTLNQKPHLPNAETDTSTIENVPHREERNCRMALQKVHGGLTETVGTIPKITSKITSKNSLSLTTEEPDKSQADPPGEEGREREQKIITSEKQEKPERVGVGDPPDFGVPKLERGDNTFTPPPWLDTERWQIWLDERDGTPLKPFSLNSECRKLGELIHLGFSQQEILDDAIARKKIRLTAPCPPGQEKRVLAERKAAQQVMKSSAEPDSKATEITQLRVQLRESAHDLRHLVQLISTCADEKQKLNLEKQKDQRDKEIFKLKRELLALGVST